jgi:ribosomal protein S12 methylthiotransferase accessory factor
VLLDPISEYLIPLLSGDHSAEAIAEELSAQFPLEQSYFALQRLEEQGYVCERLPGPVLAAAAFWASAGLAPAAAANRKPTVSIQVLGDIDASAVKRAVQDSNVLTDSAAPLHLVFTEDYLAPELARVNANALSRGTAWMLFNPTGRELWLGPLFRPGDGACWECLASRLRSARFLHRYNAQNPAAIRTGPAPVLPATMAIAVHYAALEALKFFATDGRSPLLNKIVTLDVLRNTTPSYDAHNVCALSKTAPLIPCRCDRYWCLARRASPPTADIESIHPGSRSRATRIS